MSTRSKSKFKSASKSKKSTSKSKKSTSTNKSKSKTLTIRGKSQSRPRAKTTRSKSQSSRKSPAQWRKEITNFMVRGEWSNVELRYIDGDDDVPMPLEYEVFTLGNIIEAIKNVLDSGKITKEEIVHDLLDNNVHSSEIDTTKLSNYAVGVMVAVATSVVDYNTIEDDIFSYKDNFIRREVWRVGLDKLDDDFLMKNVVPKYLEDSTLRPKRIKRLKTCLLKISKANLKKALANVPKKSEYFGGGILKMSSSIVL